MFLVFCWTRGSKTLEILIDWLIDSPHFSPAGYPTRHVVTRTPLLSLQVPVHSLLSRIRTPTTHSHTSTSPPPRRIQPTHLYKDKFSSLNNPTQSTDWTACLNLRVEKHFGWACLEARRKWRWRDLNSRHKPQWVVPATHWTTRATGLGLDPAGTFQPATADGRRARTTRKRTFLNPLYLAVPCVQGSPCKLVRL